jgi:predicted transcriptional regulator
MANRRKPDNLKASAVIPVRVTPALKKALDELAEETGVSTSERARTCLEALLRRAKQQTPPDD